ncbi:MAG TPA: hypothetical protein VME47_21025 [Acetobacteraceae bacterium]|nr:hypothetical protein [Acetobacteraceae bacterium]
MPDMPVEPATPGRYPGDMESRVAVLEQIARETTASLGRIERGMDAQREELRALQERFERGMDAQRKELHVFQERFERGMDAQRKELLVFQERFERRLDMQAAEHRTEFRWLLGVMLGGFTTLLGAFGAMLGVMAHGFHWI